MRSYLNKQWELNWLSFDFIYQGPSFWWIYCFAFWRSGIIADTCCDCFSLLLLLSYRKLMDQLRWFTEMFWWAKDLSAHYFAYWCYSIIHWCCLALLLKARYTFYQYVYYLIQIHNLCTVNAIILIESLLYVNIVYLH